jgi:hypothetical protein
MNKNNKINTELLNSSDKLNETNTVNTEMLNSSNKLNEMTKVKTEVLNSSDKFTLLTKLKRGLLDSSYQMNLVIQNKELNTFLKDNPIDTKTKYIDYNIKNENNIQNLMHLIFKKDIEILNDPEKADSHFSNKLVISLSKEHKDKYNTIITDTTKTVESTKKFQVDFKNNSLNKPSSEFKHHEEAISKNIDSVISVVSDIISKFM